ncbi:MAG: endopeptidase La [Spirochaetales bacterium]|uniref:Lon protease n=1 Tax=Candidatus Thalassospirochaeta sargassi TaxID=3119039 RepID=A0AAJ1IDK7_9SPIO|nr:endopeptidase La [Spirochaetales bacterium]
MTTEIAAERIPVLPLENSILLHEGRAEIKINPPTAGIIKGWVDRGHQNVLATGLKDENKLHNLTEEDLYKTGVLIQIISTHSDGEGVLLKADVVERAEISKFYFEKNEVLAEYRTAPDIMDISQTEYDELLSYLKSLIHEIAEQFRGSKPMLLLVDRQDSITKLIGFSAPYMNTSRQEKQDLLEIRSVHERGIKFLDYMLKQKESMKLQIEMANKFAESTNKQYRQAMLRQQMKEIQKELDEDNPGKKEKKDYRQMINEADMPDYAREAALEEVDKLEAQGPNGHEEGMIKTYLDLILALPWNQKSNGKIDLKKAREILNRDHFGLDKVKDRIVQHLAVMKLTEKKRGTILLFEGPPGTGKTSLGKSIAEALGRKYVRVSLGGIRDEAEIRGHRRTYIGALPGRIISEMKKAGERDPVFVLDEVDKLMTAYNGDPASALLEVLDPEQNDSFSDRYLDIPFDLSEVFFIATANSVSSIPAPLLDRMEVISISSYTNTEKYHIGFEHLIPSVLDEHGLDSQRLVITDDALRAVIENYTREAGVRGLKKQLAKIARVSSEKIVNGDTELPITVEEENLEDILGRRTVRLEDALKDNFPGVVTGLAWTPVGGDILFIESTFMPGKGELVLTGQLGDVMKESARISLSLIRSRLAHQITHFDFAANDIHIHVPAGSTPKDGPSAGITLFTSLASLITGQSVDTGTAMTGEITLRGTVLPVGGIKEKVLAAHRAGIKRIIMSTENREDLKEIPAEAADSIEFMFVERVEEVIDLALGITLPEQTVLNIGNQPLAGEQSLKRESQ